MSTLGYAALILAAAAAALGVLTGALGSAVLGRRAAGDLAVAAAAGTGDAAEHDSLAAGLLRTSRATVYVAAGACVIASAGLLGALLTHDFSNEYVYSYSSLELPWYYGVSAFWAGGPGSLLLWLLLLSLLSALVVFLHRRRDAALVPHVATVLLVNQLFFAMLILLFPGSNPFAATGSSPANGLGLNPMLQNPGMVFHPLALYLGYVGLAVPFAFAMAALLSGRLDDGWIRSSRRWLLLAWLFLTIGNIVGAWWAYVTLGWGGYWAWDPVENASLMPWLTATALLHSVMMQEKKDMLKVWNMALVIVTFSLTIFGTFITRSGVIGSVHAFGDTGIGPFFLGFLGLILAVALGLVGIRWRRLRSSRELDRLISRESSFLLNNLILVGIAFAVFFGVVYPLIHKAATGQERAVGVEFFNGVVGPIGLALMLLIGICPLIPWRGATLKRILGHLAYPGAAGLLVAAVLLAGGVRQPAAILGFAIAGFVLTATALEFVRGTRARRDMAGERLPRAFGRLVSGNRRRYGGFTVHIGLILLLIGVIGSQAFKQEVPQQTLGTGETLVIGDYRLTYERLSFRETAEKQVSTAEFSLSTDGGPLGTLTPVLEYYLAADQVWTRVDKDVNLARDVYVSLLQAADDGSEVVVKVDINPLVSWLWIGGFVMGFGALVSLWPARRRAVATATAESGGAGRVPLPAGAVPAAPGLSSALLDLEFDYRAGKVSEEDYRRIRVDLETEAQQVQPLRPT